MHRVCLLLCVGLSAVACSDPPADTVECQIQLDCGRGEVCQGGQCVVMSGPRDTGVRDVGPPPDTGTVVDTGTPVDAGMPDTGPEDAGPPDSGPSCPLPITIDGLGAYCDFAEAVNAAAPGATVQLPGATWAGSVTVDRALTIVGAGPTTILTGSGPPTLTLAAANITVRDLTIEAAGSVGIDVAQQATVEVVTITGAAEQGVVVRGTGVLTLTDSTIGAVTGLPPSGGSNLWVEAGGVATVERSQLDDGESFGVLVSGGRLTLRATDVAGSGLVGIDVQDGSTVVIEQTSRVIDGLGPGITVFTADFEMRDSQSLRNGPVGGTIEDGLWLASPTRAVVTENTLSNNRGYGIFCSMDVIPDVCTLNVMSGNEAGSSNCPNGCQ